MRSRDRITLIVGGTALVVSVFAVGGGLRPVVAVLVGLAVITAGTQVTSRRAVEGLSPLLLVLGLAFGLTAAQLIPLPDQVAATLAPTPHALILDGELLLETSRTWRPLSLDPGAGFVELAKLGAYLLLAWVALRAAHKERGRQRLLMGVAGVAGAVAVIAAIHELVGATSLFGIYEPSHLNPVVMAPLLNANHLACLMMLGALVAAGLALHERRAPSVRALWGVIALGCVLIGLATRSRGGVVALAAGTTVMAVAIVVQRLRATGESSRRDVLRVTIPATIVVICTLVLAVYLGGGEVRDELEATRLEELEDPRSKYAAWSSALALVREAPVLGVGRGAFETAFTRVHPASAQLTFSHVENEYVQVVVDWGLGGALLLGGALAYAIVVGLRRWRNGPLAAGALGGLTAVGVQSLVDFGLEIPGVAVPTLIVAATLLYVPFRETARSSRRTFVRAALVGVVALTGVLVVTPLARTVEEDHRALREAPSVELAKAAFQRHPLDYFAAASVARTSPDPGERGPMLTHALRLHPTHPDLHRAVARLLVASKRHDQATLEYRLALLGVQQPERMLLEIVNSFPTPALAAQALPPEHPRWLRIVIGLVDIKRDDVALEYLSSIGASRPFHPPELWQRMFTLADKLGDHARAEHAARALAKIEPTVASAVRVARIQMARKDYDGALATLTAARVSDALSPDHIAGMLLACDVVIARTQWVEARACLDKMSSAAYVTPQVRQKIHSRLAVIEDALGNAQRAAFERRLAGER